MTDNTSGARENTRLHFENARLRSKYERLRDAVAEYERYHFSVERLNNLIVIRNAIESEGE